MRLSRGFRLKARLLTVQLIDVAVTDITSTRKFQVSETRENMGALNRLHGTTQRNRG